ncbi:C1 family peptidase [bacterium]|nr:C1 family peptidase [bacterium]
MRWILSLFLLLCLPGFSHSQDSADTHSFGLKPLDERQYQSIPLALVPLSGELPRSVDLSKDMPPVGFQGKQASCVGWSVAYALRTYFMRRQEEQWDTNSPDFQFSPSYIYNQHARGNCQAGITFVDALNTLTAEGASSMRFMPYRESECLSQPGEEAKRWARNYRIAGYRRINIQDLNEIKAQLAAGFPILAGVSTDDIFLKLQRNQIWKSSGTPSGYHAIVLVGFDDNVQAFKIMNSWGGEWGTGGYGWIDYNFFRHVTHEGYIAASFPKTTPTPTPTPTPIPTPPVQQPVAAIEIIGVEHNVNAGSANAGMNVQLRYTLKGYAGYNGQIVLHFTFSQNYPVRAALENYRDINNNAAAGTQVFYIEKPDYSNYVFSVFVPYTAFYIAVGSWNAYGQYQYVTTQMMMAADLFVNNFGVAQSAWIPFQVSR